MYKAGQGKSDLSGFAANKSRQVRLIQKSTMSHASSQIDEPDIGDLAPINAHYHRTAFPSMKSPNTDYITLEEKDHLAKKLSSQAKRRNSFESQNGTQTINEPQMFPKMTGNQPIDEELCASPMTKAINIKVSSRNSEE